VGQALRKMRKTVKLAAGLVSEDGYANRGFKGRIL
jgi:hypothetical protein